MIEEAVDFIKTTRKLFLYKTKRYNGYTYIGYCHLLSVGNSVDKNKITKKEAAELLVKDVKKINKQLDNVLKVDITNNQRIALISIIYDIGITAFRSDEILININKGLIISSSLKFRRYGYHKKKLIYSLMKARKAEIELITRESTNE